MKSQKEETEMRELEELESEIRSRMKEGTIELTEEEQDMIFGGSMSPYMKKKTMLEIKKRLFG